MKSSLINHVRPIQKRTLDAGSEFPQNMDGEWSFASSREFCPQCGSILLFPESGTVVMKSKTCPYKVNAKSKFGIYIFCVETVACKVVCDGSLTCALFIKKKGGRRGRDVAK